MAITFNALSYSKQLKAVGVSPQEAEVHAESLCMPIQSMQQQNRIWNYLLLELNRI